jgi:hypothetical protein
MKNSAIDPGKYQHTDTMPTRRVQPETKPAPAAPDPAPPKPDAPAASKPAAASKLPALAVLLLLWLMLAGSALATSTFSFTNDWPVGVTTMFYTNTANGYFFLQATNTASGTSNTLSTAMAAQGVAVQATNSDMARLVPFASLPPTGSAVSLIISNTATMTAGVPKNTTVFGTNIAAGTLFTSVAPGTNAVSSSSYNTNLP